MTRKQENLIVICIVVCIILLSITVRFVTNSTPYNHYLDDKAFADLQESLGVEDIGRCYLSYPAPDEEAQQQASWRMDMDELAPYFTMEDVVFVDYKDNDTSLPWHYAVEVVFLNQDRMHLSWDVNYPERFECSYDDAETSNGSRSFFVKIPRLTAYLQERYEEMGGR